MEDKKTLEERKRYPLILKDAEYIYKGKQKSKIRCLICNNESIVKHLVLNKRLKRGTPICPLCHLNYKKAKK